MQHRDQIVRKGIPVRILCLQMVFCQMVKEMLIYRELFLFSVIKTAVRVIKKKYSYTV